MGCQTKALRCKYVSQKVDKWVGLINLSNSELFYFLYYKGQKSLRRT